MKETFHEEKVIITEVGNIPILANSVSVIYLTEAQCLHGNMWFFFKVPPTHMTCYGNNNT